jgi:hypothetical protein
VLVVAQVELRQRDRARHELSIDRVSKVVSEAGETVEYVVFELPVLDG